MLSLKCRGTLRRLLMLVVCAAVACGDDDGASDAGASDGGERDGSASGRTGGRGGSTAPSGDGGDEDAGAQNDGGATPSDSGAGSGGGGATDSGSEPCGDGVVDDDETCDTAVESGAGECPTSCDDDAACTLDTLAHEDTCQAECAHEDITADHDGDGCCLPGSTGVDDDDCPPTRLDVRLDDDAISSELGTTHTITVTLGASDGFAGDVQLALSVVDGSGDALTTWTVVLGDDDLSVPENGEVTTQLTVTIPTQREALAATVTVAAISNAMAGDSEASASFELLDRVTIPMEVNDASGECVYPPAGNMYIKVGTTLRWLNIDSDPTQRITIHVNPNDVGCQHEPDPGTAPGAAYACTFEGNTAGEAFAWYCHAPGPNVAGRMIVPVN